MREGRARKEGGNFWLNFELLANLYTFMAAPTRTILRNLSRDDGDFNENDRDQSNRFELAKQQLCACITLFGTLHCRHCTTTTWKRHENATTTFFSFPEPRYSFLEFNSRKICQHLKNWHRWNKRDKVWSCANSLLKRRFRSRRRPLKLLI